MNEENYFVDTLFVHVWPLITAGQLTLEDNAAAKEYVLRVKCFMLTISYNP